MEYARKFQIALAALPMLLLGREPSHSSDSLTPVLPVCHQCALLRNCLEVPPINTLHLLSYSFLSNHTLQHLALITTTTHPNRPDCHDLRGHTIRFNFA
jgi:hypothetical protein